MRDKKHIRISGVVQGVGFRPFVFRAARKNNINGYVRNLGDAGIEVLAEGDLKAFLSYLKENKPKNARIDQVELEEYSGEVPPGFRILPSGGAGIGGRIPPDFGVCEHCVSELFSKKDRRQSYPLITCTDCGPRFSTLRTVPVDRDNTSFRDFPPCRDCTKEYDDTLDRRFFAQTVACPECGPRYRLFDRSRKEIENPISSAIAYLLEGRILALKGVGGMHLACLTSRDEVVGELRRRLRRPSQPFAVMSPLSRVRSFAHMGAEEEKVLRSRERPIVVLNKKENLSDLIAPGLHNVGVILPYTGLHHLLFERIDEPMILTSANVHGEPMITRDEDIFENASAAYYLLPDIEIVNRCDDSVVRFVNLRPAFIRRSRGFVPVAVGLPGKENILSFGAERNNTFCLAKKGYAFLSQHIGNTLRVSTLGFLEETVQRFLEMIPTDIERIACDLHPDFNTTRLAENFAKEKNIPLVRVQHHISHVASLVAEHGLDEIVGVCCDGVGYGLDGRPWGGEIFSYTDDFKRVGHLAEQRMPGGDLATKYPARMVAGFLFERIERCDLAELISRMRLRHGAKEAEVVVQQLEKDLNVQYTSSAGRFLDAASCLLGVSDFRGFDGEPAMKLESAARGGRWVDLPIKTENNILDTGAIMEALLELRGKEKTRDLAFSAQRALALGVSRIAVRCAEDQGIRTVGFSGGVAYNDLITQVIAREVRSSDLKFVQNQKIPPGDGGVSYGQAAYLSLMG